MSDNRSEVSAPLPPLPPAVAGGGGSAGARGVAHSGGGARSVGSASTRRHSYDRGELAGEMPGDGGAGEGHSSGGPGRAAATPPAPAPARVDAFGSLGLGLGGGAGAAASRELVQSAAETTPLTRLARVVRALEGAGKDFHTRSATAKHTSSALLTADASLSAQLARLQSQLAATERQQNRAIEDEDFETAESLNGALESVRAQIETAEAEARRLTGRIEACERAKVEALEANLGSMADALGAIRIFRDEQRSSLNTFRRDSGVRAAAMSERLKDEEEHVRFTAEKIEKDYELVQAVRARAADVGGVVRCVCVRACACVCVCVCVW